VTPVSKFEKYPTRNALLGDFCTLVSTNTGNAKRKDSQMALQCKLFKLLPTDTANPAEVCVTSA
jgi:hypothetical protein